MGTLSGLFDLSRGALAANQAALDATANNVANQNTAGYTREVVSFSAGDTVTLSGVGAQSTDSGTGPQVTTSSSRDRVLEQRVQQQMQLQSGTSAESDVLTQIQNVFSVSGSTASAGSTQSLNSGISSSVTAVNALTKTIAGLNQQIGAADPHGDAGSLEDQRQLAIEQLSQYVGLDQISTENNGITLTTQGGAVLVQGSTASALTAVTSGGATQIQDSSGANISAGIVGGSIGGQLAGQNVALPAATTALDALAYRIATAVNAQNQAGLTTTGAAGAAIFSVPASAAGAAAAISVSASDPSAIASAGLGEGESGNTNATALANLSQTTNSSGQTILDQLSAMVAQIGSSASSLQEQSTAQQATLTQLTTQRDSVSAVSLDTEAANLSQYQKSYQAAAQLLTVLDGLMATAINLGTPTTVT
jgi:flagellar hook-associated protein 1 FlgK